MKYSLVNNVCPVCGAALLGDTEIQAVKGVGNDIRFEEFSKSLSDILIYDISLFIYSKYLKVTSTKNDVDDGVELAGANSEESVVDPSGSGDADGDTMRSFEDARDEDLESLRDSVRSEALSGQLDDSGLEAFSRADEDDDHKVARLKRLAREARLSAKTGTKVNRVGRSN
tara:strand:- start:686 stop:1198 length:513 start_codon:yes stop_codon:yes gene_type:complete